MLLSHPSEAALVPVTDLSQLPQLLLQIFTANKVGVCLTRFLPYWYVAGPQPLPGVLGVSQGEGEGEGGQGRVAGGLPAAQDFYEGSQGQEIAGQDGECRGHCQGEVHCRCPPTSLFWQSAVTPLAALIRTPRACKLDSRDHLTFPSARF